MSEESHTQPPRLDVRKLKPEQYSIELTYSTVREEILKRIELRQQILSFTLTIAGAFLAVGLTTASVALIYPALAMFLAVGWSQNDYRIRDLAYYLRTCIEPHLDNLGWETHMHSLRAQSEGRSSFRYIVVSHGGAFLLTQMMAIVIGLSNFAGDPVEYVLLILDVLSILVVLRLFNVFHGR